MKRNMPCKSQETRKFQAQGTVADAKSLKQERIHYSQRTEEKYDQSIIIEGEARENRA